MKILHLADLHIGKVLLEQSLIEDQKYILKEILAIIDKEEVSVVLISGDVYDRSIPTIEAVQVLDNFFTELNKRGVTTLVISGNHDSKERLSFGKNLLSSQNLYIESIFSGELSKIILEDEHGPINFYLLPFVKPADVRPFFEDEINSYDDAVRVIMENTIVNEHERNILLAHQFVVGSGIEVERCDSESLNLGGIDSVSVSYFDKFDYVALGHVHGPQKLLKDTVRYAGSPLKYSFSESNHKKTVPVLTFTDKLSFELVPLLPIRDVREIKGPLEKLLSKEVYSLNNTSDYIKATLTDEEELYDPIGKLRNIYPNLLRLEFENTRTGISLDSKSRPTGNLKERTPLSLFREFHILQNNVPLSVKEEKILTEIIEEVSYETNSTNN